MPAQLDIIIPVYNEGENILPVLRSFRKNVRTPFGILICYDDETDTTLPAVAQAREEFDFDIHFVKNEVGQGPHGAVMSGFNRSKAPYVLVVPADDDFNAPMIDSLVKSGQTGSEIVCASRFIPGGSMVGCPWLKFFLVRASSLLLRYIAFLPVHDATNGFRLFSRKILDRVRIESTQGFTYSIELLVKAHRLGWKISEVPAQWIERRKGASRFKVGKWIFAYLQWFLYGFATTYLFKGPDSVPMRVGKSARPEPQPNLSP